ncbi:MAG: hypothetical protein E3J78_01300 [Candidatus Cloacimonadota bacterium]|nr:MAG: hypothetical protein E3J78_01300 [Candidatus Cloacimonadota bacterium]
MIDIHTHILPGIDDGPKDIDASIELLRDAAMQGIGTVFATPHFIRGLYEPTVKKIKRAFCSLQARINAESIPIELIGGLEIGIESEIEGRELKKHSLNEGKYVLLELPFVAYSLNCEERIFWYQSQGVIPIIAHPERAFSIMKQPDKLKDWKRRGILIQINSKSLIGRYNKVVKKLAIRILKQGLVDFVATDTHSRKWGFDFQEVRPILERLVGKHKTDDLLEHNARRLLLTEKIDAMTQ